MRICDLSHKTNIYKEGKEKGISHKEVLTIDIQNIKTHVLSGFPSSGANGKPSGSSNRNILQPTYLGAFGMANQGMRFLLHYETNWGFVRSGLGLFHKGLCMGINIWFRNNVLIIRFQGYD
ncbi:hypothetical protein Lalb_Chr04g0259721 [Lupinus albus]|uniref:Uncharacterized protein n=1 Tax=Lupinus albus TaxID=3870 RepID=A0A6A4QPL9_LUPAL|nr:hypothetical protein Lalb_Chr04g0259721 [Lupinus albus]